MGRTKKKHNCLLKTWISKAKNPEYFTIDGDTTFCQPCGKGFIFKQSSQFHQHIETHVHTENVRRYKTKPEVQLLLSETGRSCNIFYQDLCEAFIAAGIPWDKLSNPTLTQFLSKYTNKHVPDESTLRKTQLDRLYKKTVDSIRSEVGKNMIWLGVDETTDASGRYIAIVMVGALRKDRPSTSHLLQVKQLEKTNSSTISQLVLDALRNLWPEDEQNQVNEKFLLLLTDGVPYMVKAGKILKKTYSKLIHLTCLVHALHLVAEKTRASYPVVDKMVSSMKAVFRKAPSRILLYQTLLPNVAFPPQPVLTRWGTWLNACQFYAENLDGMKTVMDKLDGKDAACIDTAKKSLRRARLPYELSYIAAHFTSIAEAIEKLEAAELSLSESLKIINNVVEKLSSAPGDIGTEISNKMTTLLNKNRGFKDIVTISKILNGDEDPPQLALSLSPHQIACFAYAPISTVEVERTFSMEKNIYSEQRRSLTVENIEKILVCEYEVSHGAIIL